MNVSKLFMKDCELVWKFHSVSLLFAKLVENGSSIS